jgi:hypothetical protein
MAKEYDYLLKIIITGKDTEGTTYLANNFSKRYYTEDYKMTIGVDFYVKSFSVNGKTIKMQLWKLECKERFKSITSMFYRGSLGAIIISDISKSTFRYDLDHNIQMIKELVGDVPIVLLTFNPHSEEFQAISGVETMLTADNYKNLTFAESSLKPIQNPEVIFRKLGKYVIERVNMYPPVRQLKRPSSTRTEFIINEYLKLRLEYGITNIYVGGNLFKQCKYLLLDLPVSNTTAFNEIESIDEAAEKLDRSMERGKPRKYHLPPDIEFWGHCSNLQAWYENDYDTRILHSNLAFPLLIALVKARDTLAKKVFKEEIAQRLESGYPSVVRHLINQNYLKYLNKEEINSLLEDRKFIRNLPKWFNDFKDIPKWLSKRIKAILKGLICPYCKTKISNASINKFLNGKSMKCELCHSNLI